MSYTIPHVIIYGLHVPDAGKTETGKLDELRGEIANKLFEHGFISGNDFPNFSVIKCDTTEVNQSGVVIVIEDIWREAGQLKGLPHFSAIEPMAVALCRSINKTITQFIQAEYIPGCLFVRTTARILFANGQTQIVTARST